MIARDVKELRGLRRERAKANGELLRLRAARFADRTRVMNKAAARGRTWKGRDDADR